MLQVGSASPSRMGVLCALLAAFYAWSHVDMFMSNLTSVRSIPRFGNELQDTIFGIPDPVYVVFGNRGYKIMLANLLCNMALFPAMHEHLLLAVSDEGTADYLETFTENATVIAIDLGGMDETSDFNGFAYRELMYLRGLGLVEILKITAVQGKTVVWIEPDMHYRQSLLTTPGLSNLHNSLVSLQWDWDGFCGCLIRFPPFNASLSLYQEIMNRMSPPSVMFVSKHDQALLNDVVYDLDIPIQTLDPCLYRSGTYLTRGYADDRRTNCSGITPVIQHFNWVVGRDTKIKMAKDDGGWYLSEDESACLIG